MALDWPGEQARAVLSAFRQEDPFIQEIDYTRETGIGPFGRYLIQFKQGQDPPYDILHVASEFEDQYWRDRVFVEPPFDYRALGEALPEGWPGLDPRSLDAAGNFVGHHRPHPGRHLQPGDGGPRAGAAAWSDCLDPR